MDIQRRFDGELRDKILISLEFRRSLFAAHRCAIVLVALAISPD